LSSERGSDLEFDELRALDMRRGALSEEILVKALRSVFGGDVGLAAEVMKDDLEIDREARGQAGHWIDPLNRHRFDTKLSHLGAASSVPE
jgi:hypothetical protein